FQRRSIHHAVAPRLRGKRCQEDYRLSGRLWQSAISRDSLTLKHASTRKTLATPTTQIDPSALRARVLEVVRQLLLELGSQRVLPSLSLASNLDRDLGLGSLERVELVARLESEFGIRLPDLAAAEASTPENLATLIDSRSGDSETTIESPSAIR